MLQNIRDNAQGLVAKVIIGFIVISFAFFGVKSLVQPGQNNVASVNGDDISQVQLNRAVANERNHRMQRMGDKIDPSQLDESVLRGPVLDQLVQQRLLLQAADEVDVGVSDSSLNQTIVSMPQFQEDGKFSQERFQNILRSNGYTPAYFKQLLRTDLIIRQMSSGIAASEFVTEQEIAEVAAIVGQKRSFKYAVLSREKVAAEVAVSDADIEQYYKDHSDQFQTPDQVKLDYVELNQSKFFKPVAESDIKAAYEREVADLDPTEERRASHILVSINDKRDKAAALKRVKEIKQKLDAGGDFAKLAKEYSDDPGSARNGGDLGFTKGKTFPEDFEKALYALKLNAVSDPVLTDSGYSLIRATEINKPEAPAYEDRKPIIEQKLQMAASEAAFAAAVEQMRDLVFNSEGLQGPAKELGLTVSHSDWISRDSAKGVVADKRVLNAAFSDEVLKNGNNSDVIELADDHYIVVHVDDHEAPHTKALADVSASIKEILARQKTTEALKLLADSTVKSIEQGTALDEAAKTAGVEWKEAKAVSRTSMSVDRQLLEGVFALPEVVNDKPRIAPVTFGSGNVAVVVLNAVAPGKLDDFSKVERMGIKMEMQRGMQAADTANLVSSLRSKAEIKIM